MNDQTQPQPKKRRRSVFVCCVFLLFLAGATFYFFSQPNIQTIVEQAGGSYHKYPRYENAFRKMLGTLMNRGERDNHVIAFQHGATIDDNWLREHRRKIAQLSNLGLNLSDTKITDTGVQQLSLLTNLQHLSLGKTTLTSSAIKSIANHPNLEIILLDDTGIPGHSLSALQSMPKLTYLGMDRTQAKNGGILAINQLPHVEGMQIINADDETVIAFQSANLSRIKNLGLTGDTVTNNCVSALSKLHGLTFLALGGTSIDEEHVEQLKQALPGCAVQVYPLRESR